MKPYDLTRDQVDERWASVPDVIRNLSHENPVIHDLVERYTSGLIVTKEELLLQLIIHLNISWDKMKQEYIDYRAMVVRPLIIPRRPDE